MRASHRLLLALGLAAPALVLGSSSRAAAQTEDPARLEQARDLYRNGVTAFRARRFGEAVVAFERSFRLRPHPTTLYNAAEARLRAGDRERAVEQLRDLLAMTTPAPDADTAERARTLAREAGEADLQPSPPPMQCPPQRECPAPTPCPECPPPRIVGGGPVPWHLALVAGGGAVLALGTAFYAAALADAGAYNAPETPVSVRLWLRDQGETFRAVGLTTFLLGAAAEGVGIYFMTRPPRASERAAAPRELPLTAHVVPTYGGAALVGSF